MYAIECQIIVLDELEVDYEAVSSYVGMEKLFRCNPQFMICFRQAV